MPKRFGLSLIFLTFGLNWTLNLNELNWTFKSVIYSDQCQVPLQLEIRVDQCQEPQQ